MKLVWQIGAWLTLMAGIIKAPDDLGWVTALAAALIFAVLAVSER